MKLGERIRKLRKVKGVKKRVLQLLGFTGTIILIILYIWYAGPQTPAEASNLFWIGVYSILLLWFAGIIWIRGYRQAKTFLVTLHKALVQMGLDEREAFYIAKTYITTNDDQEAADLLFNYTLNKIAEKRVVEMLEREKDAIMLTLQRRLELELGMPISNIRKAIQAIASGELVEEKRKKKRRKRQEVVLVLNTGQQLSTPVNSSEEHDEHRDRELCPKCKVPLITLLDGTRMCPKCRTVY